MKKHRGFRGKTFQSKYANLEAWWDDMGMHDVTMNVPFIPVCYGGVFAIQTSLISGKKHWLEKIEHSLERKDNIEEGHFAERTWVALFSKPLVPNQVLALMNVTNEVITKCCYDGALFRNDAIWVS
eukprot:11728886-Ditylum_brightwellii.AAC.1